MPGAIHRFQSELVFFDVEGEHVVGVVRPVAGGLPEFGVVDVGGDYFLEAAFAVLFFYEVDEGVVDVGTTRLEEAGAGG